MPYPTRVLTPALAACWALATPAAALAEAPRVVTDLPAVHSLAAQVMDGIATPELLLERGASPHHYQLRPSQASALAKADLVLWISPELTPWMGRAVSAIAGSESQLQLSKVPGLHVQDFAEEGAVHDDHEHEHEHDDHNDDGDHDHIHEGQDPHLWLDPENARLWLDVIANRLSAIDPEHSVAYSANAATARQQLEALETDLNARLAPVADTSFAVFHDAYGYFTGHFGLHQAHPLALGDATTPSAARLAALRETIRSEQLRCVFPEAQHDPRLMERVIEGTDAALGEPLDPSGSSLEPGPELYSNLLIGMAQNLTECLQRAPDAEN